MGFSSLSKIRERVIVPPHFNLAAGLLDLLHDLTYETKLFASHASWYLVRRIN